MAGLRRLAVHQLVPLHLLMLLRSLSTAGLAEHLRLPDPVLLVSGLELFIEPERGVRLRHVVVAADVLLVLGVAT